MPRLEPDSVNPRCPKCGEKIEEVAHWSEKRGIHFTWRCSNSECEWREYD